jgi:hypothetical protein
LLIYNLLDAVDCDPCYLTALAAAKSPQVQNTTAEWVDPIILQLQASAQSAVDAANAANNDMEGQEEVFIPPTEQELMAE